MSADLDAAADVASAACARAALSASDIVVSVPAESVCAALAAAATTTALWPTRSPPGSDSGSALPRLHLAASREDRSAEGANGGRSGAGAGVAPELLPAAAAAAPEDVPPPASSLPSSVPRGLLFGSCSAGGGGGGGGGGGAARKPSDGADEFEFEFDGTPLGAAPAAPLAPSPLAWDDIEDDELASEWAQPATRDAVLPVSAPGVLLDSEHTTTAAEIRPVTGGSGVGWNGDSGGLVALLAAVAAASGGTAGFAGTAAAAACAPGVGEAPANVPVGEVNEAGLDFCELEPEMTLALGARGYPLSAYESPAYYGLFCCRPAISQRFKKGIAISVSALDG